MAKSFGISKEHLYLITNTTKKDNRLSLKLHNPFNTIVDTVKQDANSGEFW
jgi:hypothetical protein